MQQLSDAAHKSVIHMRIMMLNRVVFITEHKRLDDKNSTKEHLRFLSADILVVGDIQSALINLSLKAALMSEAICSVN